VAKKAEIAEAYRRAEAIGSARKADADTRTLEREYVAFLRDNQAALEPKLRSERSLFYTYPQRWEDIRFLADNGAQFYLDAVREYDFEGWAGDELPPEFFLFRNIETAYLGGTDFELIAGDWKSLKKLKTLSADEIWTLRELDNPSVAEAPAIESVAFNWCGLEVFPQQLFAATTLKRLSVAYCHDGSLHLYPFPRIPPGISKLTNLKELDLSGLGLSEIPPDLLEMTWLKALFLFENLIEKKDQERLRTALPNTKIQFELK
jgi:hypothetical protein